MLANKKIKSNTSFILSLIALPFLLSSFVFGVYYIRYEVLFSALISGEMTPGLLVNDLFYLTHVFLINIYAFVISHIPNIPWVYYVQQMAVMFSAFLLLKSISKTVKNSYLFFILIPCFLLVYFSLYLNFQTAFFIALCSVLSIIINQEEKYKILAYALILFAILTRIEAAIIVILLTSVYYFSLLQAGSYLQRFKQTLKIFLVPTLIIFSLIFWFSLDKSNSEMFYKQIEPDVEYNLAENDNIIPIAAMQNKIDSFRYMAIDRNMWGDASTNSASFLRSLIKTNNTEDRLSNAFRDLDRMFKDNIHLLIFVNILFLTLLALYLKRKKIAFTLILYHLFFYSLLLALGVYAKISNEAVFSMHFLLILAYLLLICNEADVKQNKKFKRYLIASTTVFCLFHLVFFVNIISSEKKKQAYISTEYNEIETLLKNKNVYLNKESRLLLYSFKANESFDFSMFKKFILYDSQHISTIEPYRTYLESLCNCDPNNYFEYFSYVLNNGEDNIFIMSESYKDFLTEYLKIVHGLNVYWINIAKKETKSSFFQKHNYVDEPLILYQISKLKSF